MLISQQEFDQKLLENKNFIVWEELISDLITPVSCLLNIAEKYKYYCLFESVTGGERRGRYSIIAFDAEKLWKCENRKSYFADVSKNSENINFVEAEEKNVFKSLKNFVEDSQIDMPEGLPSLSAGVFGYMGYDMVKLMEDLPDDNSSYIDMPDGVYFRPKIIIVFDNISDKAYLAHPIYKNTDGFIENYESVKNRLAKIKKEIFKTADIDNFKSSGSKNEVNFKSHISREEFYKMVEKSIEYIKAGDIFQIVPSRRFSADFAARPTSFFRSLRSLNPSPYLFIVNIDDFSIIGSSPEILVKVENNEVTLRPLAGTRKRGANLLEDEALKKDLLADKKELAEHLMLLDLGRNDASRVCDAGSINVTEKMTVELYSHVMHIVSNVTGTLSKKHDYMDALIAGFPAGTVSGAPKIRAMEIIDELENENRQFYAGTVGYFSATGDLNTCIALRTALIKDKKIYVQAGAGVVYDSIAENEYLETENKAMALINAAKAAINYE